ncbi:hypothetical protein MHK_007220, partial [Candidatus Magnetomorum sp. HK-1]
PDISNNILSAGHNLIGNIAHFEFSSNTIGDIYGDPYQTTIANSYAFESVIEIEPKVSPLLYFNSTIPFHLIQSTSPAIDFGDCINHDNNSIIEDQRNNIRPSGGNSCDIGSIEMNKKENNNIFFLSQPPKNKILQPGEKHIYNISVFDISDNLKEIKLMSNASWLQLKEIDLSNGKAILEGKVSPENLGFFTVTVQATNDVLTVNQSYNIEVLIFLEDFENEFSKFQEHSNTINSWHIGSGEAKFGKRSAYISNDEGQSSTYDYNQGISTFRTEIDLKYFIDAELSFWWKCKGSHYIEYDIKDYGFVTISDGIGLTKTTSALLHQEEWTKKIIDLSDYFGKNIVLIFTWVNSRHNTEFINKDSGFCIDNILVKGKYESKPFFINQPKTIIGINRPSDSPFFPHIPIVWPLLLYFIIR